MTWIFTRYPTKDSVIGDSNVIRTQDELDARIAAAEEDRIAYTYSKDD